jgi:hypothetical protein
MLHEFCNIRKPSVTIRLQNINKQGTGRTKKLECAQFIVRTQSWCDVQRRCPSSYIWIKLEEYEKWDSNYGKENGMYRYTSFNRNMIKRMTHVTMKFWREETISDKRRVNSYLS